MSKCVIKFGLRSAFAWAVAACMVAAATPANGALVLNIGNSCINSYPARCASVAVSLMDRTHASVVFTGASNATDYYLMGGQGAVGLNAKAASESLSVSSITG